MIFRKMWNEISMLRDQVHNLVLINKSAQVRISELELRLVMAGQFEQRLRALELRDDKNVMREAKGNPAERLNTLWDAWPGLSARLTALEERAVNFNLAVAKEKSCQS